MRTIIALLCAVSCAAVLVGGCSSPGPGPELPAGPEFRDRTSPDNVMYNLELSYEEMNLEEYLDCLSLDFQFFPDERDVQNSDFELPTSWYKTDEQTMHESMFADESDVESISVTLTTTDIDLDTGADPQDPADDIYIYVVDVDLRVNLRGANLTYLATAPSRFLMRVDADQQGPGGVHLWEIYMWYDLGDQDRGGGDDTARDTSWGIIKFLYW